jgi:hypothetical protein
VSAWLVAGALVACARPALGGGPFGAMLCGLVVAGAMASTASDVTVSRPTSTVYASAGGRVALEYALTPVVSLRLFADVLATLTDTHLLIADHGGNVEVWGTWPVSLTAGLGVDAHFR